MTPISPTAPPLTVSCDKCHLSTCMPALLRETPRPFTYKTKDLCPRCTERNRTTTLATLFYLNLAITVAFIVLPRTYILRDPAHQWLLAIFVSITLVQPLLIALHECAHAAVGAAVGFRLYGITLGFGPQLAQWRTRNHFFALHLFPLSGRYWHSISPNLSRRRYILMVAAGPAVHLAAILLVLCYMGPALLSPDHWHEFKFAITFLLINLYLFTISMTPRDFRWGNYTLRTDGKRIRTLLSDPNAITKPTLAFAAEINLCLSLHFIKDAARLLEENRPAFGNDPTFQIIECCVLAAEGNWAQVRTNADRALAATSDPQQRDPFAAWAAVARVYEGEDLATADALSMESMKVEPWSTDVQTVRAVVLLAQGQTREAAHFLKSADTHPFSWPVRAAAAQARAELHARTRHPFRHRLWQRRAAALDPQDVFKIPN